MSTSPGTVRWTSQKRSSPSQGKCGFATSIPPPDSERSEPIAQPFDAATGSTLPGAGAAASSSDGSPPSPASSAAPGGSAVAR